MIIGVDEVGRGALAGPVVAGAVAFKKSTWGQIDDSKRLTARKREELNKVIRQQAIVGIGEVGVAGINKIGIAKATAVAMRQAIAKVKSQKLKVKSPSKNSKTFVLVDAFHVKYIPGVGLANQRAMVKGDQKVLSIAAASIIAKVYRDKVMRKIHRNNPGYREYRWDRNKGYGTADHLAAIKRHGITRLHRLAFVKNII